jgi:hypothetical protein
MLLSLVLSVLVTSCHKKSEDIHLLTIKNIRLFTTKAEFGATMDSLVENDPAIEFVPYEGKRFMQMRIDRDAGNPYFAYILPTFDNGVVTKLTLMLYSESNAGNAASFIRREEESLLYWGNPKRVNDEMLAMVQSKYGFAADSGYVLSINRGTNHILRHKAWKKAGLEIKLISEVEENTGLSDFAPFCNFIIEYSPTDKFLKENEEQISEYRRRNSAL